MREQNEEIVEWYNNDIDDSYLNFIDNQLQTTIKFKYTFESITDYSEMDDETFSNNFEEFLKKNTTEIKQMKLNENVLKTLKDEGEQTYSKNIKIHIMKKIELEKQLTEIDEHLSVSQIKKLTFDQKLYLISKSKEISELYNYSIDDILSDICDIENETIQEELIIEIPQKELKNKTKMQVFEETLEKQKKPFDSEKKVCDVFTHSVLLNFQKHIKNIRGEPNSFKIPRFSYMDITKSSDWIIKQITGRSTEWGVVIVTENDSSFGLFRNNKKKKTSLFVLKRFGKREIKCFESLKGIPNFVDCSKNVSFENPFIENIKESDEKRDLQISFTNQSQKVTIHYEFMEQEDYYYDEKSYYVWIEGSLSDAFGENVTNDIFLLQQDDKIYKEKTTNIVIYTIQ